VLPKYTNHDATNEINPPLDAKCIDRHRKVPAAGDQSTKTSHLAAAIALDAGIAA
jgi:hypothetical protein